MARLALERALPADCVDEVFEAHLQWQYSRELLFSTVIELTTLVSLGLRPSLHAAARQMPALPVSLACLYDKVNHAEPGVLCTPPAALLRSALRSDRWAMVRGSAKRLGLVMAVVGKGASSLPSWRLRGLDGNHLLASGKRLSPLRGFRGAALPGQSLVVYDPDLGLVVDLVACEDAHASAPWWCRRWMVCSRASCGWQRNREAICAGPPRLYPHGAEWLGGRRRRLHRARARPPPAAGRARGVARVRPGRDRPGT